MRHFISIALLPFIGVLIFLLTFNGLLGQKADEYSLLKKSSRELSYSVPREARAKVSKDNPQDIPQWFQEYSQKEKSISTKDRLTWLFSGVAILITLWVFGLNFRYNAILQHNRFFLDIDKHLLDNPSLWVLLEEQETLVGKGVELKEEQNASIEKDIRLFESKLKRQAFAYYILNSFESIFHFYRVGVFWFFNCFFKSNPWSSWDSYFEGVYSRSSEFRNVVDVALEREYYQGKFMKYLLEIKGKYALNNPKPDR